MMKQVLQLGRHIWGDQSYLRFGSSPSGATAPQQYITDEVSTRNRRMYTGVVESRGEDARDNIGTQTGGNRSCSRVDRFGRTSRTCSFGSSPSAAASPNNVIAHEKSTDIHWCERNSVAEFFTDDLKKNRRGRRRGVCVAVRPRGPDGFAREGAYAGADSGEHATGTENPAVDDGLAVMGRVSERGGT